MTKLFWIVNKLYMATYRVSYNHPNKLFLLVNFKLDYFRDWIGDRYIWK